MENDIVIKTEKLSKHFNLYKKPIDRVKEALSLIKKNYHEDFKALECIDFEVHKGETIGIIGSNGAGKSTLLKIITGVLRQTSGLVTINGRVSALLELGTGFNPEYTGIENIELNGKMLGFSNAQIEERKKEIIRFADIGEYITQPVKNYSSGMFARLAFAVAIMIDPEILIVDEALSVGDIFFQNKCFQKFDELRQKGTSILFVSHDISTVRKMCSKVLWIEKGHQMMFDESNKVCNAYFDSQLKKISDSNLEIHAESAEIKTQSGASGKLSDYPKIEIAENSLLSERAEILSAYVTDMDGKTTKSLDTGKEYKVGIVVRFHAEVENAIVGISVSNGKGICMFAGNTFISTGKGFTGHTGDILDVVFSFRVPRIRSGSYEISPAIAEGTQLNHSVLTWLHGVLGVDIVGNEYEIAEVGVDFTTEIEKVTD